MICSLFASRELMYVELVTMSHVEFPFYDDS
jgi:hypothetical protein